MLLLAIVLAVVVIWFLYNSSKTPGYSGTRTPVSVLKARNQDYALAQTYFDQGKYDLALKSFQKSLTEASDEAQKVQIQLDIAAAHQLLGNYTEAIIQYKSVAADTSNRDGLRAYAVQELGIMRDLHYEQDVREKILAETFKGSPYDSFKKDGNVNLAYTKLFEYAASIYPLAMSEARVAYGYSNELITTLRGATTSPQGQDYLARISESLKAADSDLKRMENNSVDALFIPSVLVREGMALQRLASLGIGTMEDAEAYFQKGMERDALIGVRPGSYNAFNYAAFLASAYGKKRAVDIQNLLAPFKAGNEAGIARTIPGFYRNARSNPALSVSKSSLVLMAQIDLDFQKYLISLGWKSSDFSEK